MSPSNPDRLLIGVLGNRSAGKSHTWNTLFGREVHTGRRPHYLILQPGESVEVFLVSGSSEERHVYVGDILQNQNCRIVLCSMQYVADVQRTLEYFIDHGFSLHTHWLNPGYRDHGPIADDLNLIDTILNTRRSSLSIRDGRQAAEGRVQELREFIYG